MFGGLLGPGQRQIRQIKQLGCFPGPQIRILKQKAQEGEEDLLFEDGLEGKPEARLLLTSLTSVPTPGCISHPTN